MKAFMIIVHAPGHATEHTFNRVAAAVAFFIETLNMGDSAIDNGKNYKINLNPRSPKVLVDNLNKAVANMSPNGYSSTIYELDDY